MNEVRMPEGIRLILAVAAAIFLLIAFAIASIMIGIPKSWHVPAIMGGMILAVIFHTILELRRIRNWTD